MLEVESRWVEAFTCMCVGRCSCHWFVGAYVTFVLVVLEGMMMMMMMMMVMVTIFDRFDR